jgi:hypothetical protein
MLWVTKLNRHSALRQVDRWDNGPCQRFAARSIARRLPTGKKLLLDLPSGSTALSKHENATMRPRRRRQGLAEAAPFDA